MCSLYERPWLNVQVWMLVFPCTLWDWWTNSWGGYCRCRLARLVIGDVWVLLRMLFWFIYSSCWFVAAFVCFLLRWCCSDDVCNLCVGFRIYALQFLVCMLKFCLLSRISSIYFVGLWGLQRWLIACNAGSYYVIWVWHDVVCGIFLDSAVYTIFVPLHKVSVWL